MKIGEIARQTGATVEMIRYYEREQLLGSAHRSEGNYRVYDAAAIQRLAFIRHCRTLDMSLSEIRTLLRYQDAPDADCTEVNQLLDEHLEHVSARIKSLRELQRQLKSLREQCRTAQTTGDCGILQALSRTTGSEPAAHDAGHLGGVHTKSRKSAKVPA